MGVGKRRRRRKKKRKVSKGSKVQGHAAHPNTRKRREHTKMFFFLHPPSTLGFFPFLCLSKETSFVITRNAPQFRQLLRSSSTKRKLFRRKSQFRHVVLAIITRSRNLPSDTVSIDWHQSRLQIYETKFHSATERALIFPFSSSLTSPFVVYLLLEKKSLTDWR